MNNKTICSSCGKELDNNSNFCIYCGTKIKKVKEKVKEEKTDLEEKNIEIKEEPVIKIVQNKEEIKPIKKSNNILTIIITALITFIVTVAGGILVCSIFFDEETNNIIKTVKDVTITDTGIAESVSKVYDSVVVIKGYKGKNLVSTATGFVFEKDDAIAYILTNAHVINNCDSYSAVFTNNEIVPMKLVGSDTYSDIAVLSVSSSKVLSVAEIGSSESLRVGDTTFAVGAPVNSDTYSWTVTRGILSGKNREVEVSAPNSNNFFSNSNDNMVMEVLQTDTPINSGNSGGPLCNANGEVIGITNMKLNSSSIEGIGFAIPIETAITYADKFINGEKVTRPYLGVGMYFVSPELYSDIDITGVYVSEVEDNSAASKAGIKKGDIITKIDGNEIKSSAYLKYQLYKYNVGDKITLTYYRNNKEYQVKVTLGSNNN